MTSEPLVCTGTHEHWRSNPNAPTGIDIPVPADQCASAEFSVGPRYGPLLPAIVHFRPEDELVLVDPRGRELCLDRETVKALVFALRSTGTHFPAIQDTLVFLRRVLDG